MEDLPINLNSNPSLNSEIFTRIYRQNEWGGDQGQFYSGPGSHNAFIPGYAQTIFEFIRKNNISKIVEIGCGDFYVSGIILKLLDSNKIVYDYLGYDCVSELIDLNIDRYSKDSCRFLHKDCCVESIESGDLLIIRQVLQHLDNQSIAQIINKFSEFKYVIVTEHQMTNTVERFVKYNEDKPTDASIRIKNGSGVYLEKEPFNCNFDEIIHSIPGSAFGFEAEIKTFLFNFKPESGTGNKKTLV